MFKYEEWVPKIQHNYKINALLWWCGGATAIVGLFTNSFASLAGLLIMFYFTIQDYIDGQNNKE